jgi:hypothetical protein
MKVAVNLTQTLSQNLSNHWDGLNVEIPSPESKSNTLEINNSLKHDKISHQLYVEEESLYHKHDTENLFTSSHCTISELHALPSDEGRDELDTNPFSKST